MIPPESRIDYGDYGDTNRLIYHPPVFTQAQKGGLATESLSTIEDDFPFQQWEETGLSDGYPDYNDVGDPR